MNQFLIKRLNSEAADEISSHGRSAGPIPQSVKFNG